VTRGGARPGAGAKPKDPSLHRLQVGLTLSREDVTKADALAEAKGISRSQAIGIMIQAYQLPERQEE
jgi:hypothetical protein